MCPSSVTLKAEYPLKMDSVPGGWAIINTYLLDRRDTHLVCPECAKNEQSMRTAAATRTYKNFFQRIFG